MTADARDPALQPAIDLLRANRILEAQKLLAALCGKADAAAEHWFLLGAVEHMLGRIEAALVGFGRALALRPDHPQAANGRASLLASVGRIDEAMDCLAQALLHQPGNIEAHVNLAILLEQRGDATAALKHYDAALRLDPGCRAARLNRSAVNLSARRFEAALEDAAALLRLDARNVAALSNAAQALLALDRYEDAARLCGTITDLEPANVGGHFHAGIALACLGRLDAARAAFETARRTDLARFTQIQQQAWQAAGESMRGGWNDPADTTPDPRVIYLARGVDRLARGNWAERDAFLARFAALVREGIDRGQPICEWSLPFAGTWLPLDDVRAALAGAVARRIDESIAHAPRVPVATVRSQREPLRIGIVSPKFRNHPGATLCAPILEQHDRRRVALYGYALNPRDDGEVATRFRRSCDHVRECHGLTDASIAQRIRDDRIHILVDVGGYTDYARPEVFAMRPAPLQIAYLGFMTSLQAAWMDYFLTDAVATPFEHAGQWREQLVHLPRTLLCYDPPPANLPQPPSRKDVGLPDEGFVFCCFNNSYKLEPRAFAIWMRLLRQIPGSVLWLLHDADIERNLRAAASAHGIDPRRLVFAERVERTAHLARHQHADIFLDTFEYNAHTTAAEAYYAGLPVLTLAGRTTIARCGASIACGIGMGELVAQDEADYERLALRLAAEPDYLSSLRGRLKQVRTQSPLFDPASLARAFEHAYERMWVHHEGGSAPTAFALGPEALEREYDDSLISPYLVNTSNSVAAIR